MRAITTRLLRAPAIAQVPKPITGDKEILVKVVCAALNPTDWKHAKICWPGYIVGCDFSGNVEEIGGKVETELKVGDRIGGVVHGCEYDSPCFFPLMLELRLIHLLQVRTRERELWLNMWRRIQHFVGEFQLVRALSRQHSVSVRC